MRSLTGLFMLRWIYGLVVFYGLTVSIRTLLELRVVYTNLIAARKNGPSLYLAHAHVREAWQRFFIQLCLLGIFILGFYIPSHPYHPDEDGPRRWITVLHTLMSLIVTWKIILERHDRKILINMLSARSEKIE